jgi:hypothetical protein
MLCKVCEKAAQDVAEAEAEAERETT